MNADSPSPEERYQRPTQFSKAWELTKEATGLTRWTAVGGLMVFTIGSIAYFIWQGWPALKDELPAAVSWGIIAVVVAFFLLYLFNLIRAPYVIINEQLDVIAKLQLELEPESISARIEDYAYDYLNLDGSHYAALRLTNHNPQTVILKGLPTGILHKGDGFQQNKLDEFNAYESKLSWKGGSSEGRKMIEPGIHKSLHIAFVKDQALMFVFQTGSPREAPPGEYRVSLKIMGNLGGKQIDPILFTGLLEYYGGDKLEFTRFVA